MTSYAKEHDNIANNPQHVFLASPSLTSKFRKQNKTLKQQQQTTAMSLRVVAQRPSGTRTKKEAGGALNKGLLAQFQLFLKC